MCAKLLCLHEASASPCPSLDNRWTTFFELLVIVLAVLMHLNIPGAIRKLQQVLHTFFTMVTVLLCLQVWTGFERGLRLA